MHGCVVLRETRDGVRLRLRVKAGARSDRLAGVHDGSLKLEVRAAPERGRANAAVVKLLASSLGCSATDVGIIAGVGSRAKTVEIRGSSCLEVAERLRSLGIDAR